MASITKTATEDEVVDTILTEIAHTIYKCKFCDFITDEKILLISHYRSTHLNQVDHNSITLRTPSPMSLLPDKLEERFVCSLCYCVFLSREAVKQHMIDVRLDSNDKVKNNLFDSSFRIMAVFQ